MDEQKTQNNKSCCNPKVIIGIVLLVVVGVAVIAGFVWFTFSGFTPDKVACTMEARQCPDGSYVGRVPPNCEFAKCLPISESKDCKQHGEIPVYTAPGDDMSVQCCPGLKHRIQKNQYDENCTNLFEKFGGGGYAGICLNCGNGICESDVESRCNCPEDCATIEDCIKEGEYVDHPSKDSFECCAGLSKTDARPLDDNCEGIRPENSPGIEPGWACIKCGDGICGARYENKCNCPEDCRPQAGHAGLIYSKEASWGPCADPDGGCWQKDYLYFDGKYETVTKSGANTIVLNEEAMKMITDYVRSAGLLTDSCEHDTVLDLWITYALSLDGKTNKITFPGCEDKMNKLDRLIEINILEILNREEIIEKAKTNLHEWLNKKDYYQVGLDELELQRYETPVCRYNGRQPIRTDSCWSVGYPGRNVIEEINNIDGTLEELYYISFEIESDHQIGCGLVGGDVLITNRGRIVKTDDIELCIDD